MSQNWATVTLSALNLPKIGNKHVIYSMIKRGQIMQNYCLLSLRHCLTHWGRVSHICIDDLTINGADNGLSPGWRKAVIRTSAGILLIGPLGTNFSEILIAILIFSFKKMRLKVSSAKWQPFCLGHNVLTLNVRGPSYLGLTRSISWLLMPWLLTSPGHQQPWYWLCGIGRFLSYLRKDFNYLRRINVEKWHKM